MVESGRRPEGIESVALAAFFAQLPLVIIAVTIKAICAERFVKNRFPLAGRKCLAGFQVALPAGERGVLAQQGEIGIGLMVEFQFAAGEAPGRMAAVASSGKLPAMHIGMAVRACRGQRFGPCGIHPSFFHMACLAGQGSMFAGQRKTGAAMVE